MHRTKSKSLGTEYIQGRRRSHDRSRADSEHLDALTVLESLGRNWFGARRVSGPGAPCRRPGCGHGRPAGPQRVRRARPGHGRRRCGQAVSPPVGRARRPGNESRKWRLDAAVTAARRVRGALRVPEHGARSRRIVGARAACTARGGRRGKRRGHHQAVRGPTLAAVGRSGSCRKSYTASDHSQRVVSEPDSRHASGRPSRPVTTPATSISGSDRAPLPVAHARAGHRPLTQRARTCYLPDRADRDKAHTRAVCAPPGATTAHLPAGSSRCRTLPTDL